VESGGEDHVVAFEFVGVNSSIPTVWPLPPVGFIGEKIQIGEGRGGVSDQFAERSIVCEPWRHEHPHVYVEEGVVENEVLQWGCFGSDDLADASDVEGLEAGTLHVEEGVVSGKGHGVFENGSANLQNRSEKGKTWEISREYTAGGR